MLSSKKRSWIARTASGLAAALVLLGLSGAAHAQLTPAGTVVLGRAAEDGPTLPTYSMPVGCSESIAPGNCWVELASDAAFTNVLYNDGPTTRWGLLKDKTYYVRVHSWIFLNGSLKTGPLSPVVSYKYVAPPKLAVQPCTLEVDPRLLGSYECSGVQGTALQPAAAMRPGDLVRSPNKRYELWYQSDGNLVIYDVSATRKAVWANGKLHNTPTFVRMKTDGNLTASHQESSGEVLVWETKTAGHANASAVLQNDGNLVIYDEKDKCKPWWASKASK